MISIKAWNKSYPKDFAKECVSSFAKRSIFENNKIQTEAFFKNNKVQI